MRRCHIWNCEYQMVEHWHLGDNREIPDDPEYETGDFCPTDPGIEWVCQYPESPVGDRYWCYVCYPCMVAIEAAIKNGGFDDIEEPHRSLCIAFAQDYLEWLRETGQDHSSQHPT